MKPTVLENVKITGHDLLLTCGTKLVLWYQYFANKKFKMPSNGLIQKVVKNGLLWKLTNTI